MSLSISGITSGTSYDALDSSVASKVPVIKPTATQEIHTLAVGGQSAAVIASTLGVPVLQVDSALGITSTSSSTSEASALVALAGRLSVHA